MRTFSCASALSIVASLLAASVAAAAPTFTLTSIAASTATSNGSGVFTKVSPPTDPQPTASRSPGSQANGLIEFDLLPVVPVGQLQTATLHVYTANTGWTGSGPFEPLRIGFYMYPDDGVLDVLDATKLDHRVGSLTIGQGVNENFDGNIPVDVEYVRSLLGATRYLGMTFVMDNDGGYGINNVFIPPNYVYKPQLTFVFVPEPASIWLAIAAGIACVAVVARRSRAASRGSV